MMRAPSLPAALAAAALALTACSDGSDGEDAGPAGDTFPAGTAQTCDGQQIDLLELFAEKDVTYMAFGALWCVPCQEEVPLINSDVVDKFAGQSVGAVQILLEGALQETLATQQDCEVWVSDLEPRYTILFDADGSLSQQHFGGAVDVLPRHHLVTRTGELVFEKSGAVPDDLSGRISDWLP